MPRDKYKLSSLPDGRLTSEQTDHFWRYPVAPIGFHWAVALGTEPGLKRVENREKPALLSSKADWRGKPICFYVSKSSCKSPKKIKEWLKDPKISVAISYSRWSGKTIDELVNMAAKWKGMIVAICWFTDTPPDPHGNYPFRHYPVATEHQWYLTRIVWLDNPVAGYDPGQSVTYFRKGAVLKTFLRTIPVKFASMLIATLLKVAINIFLYFLIFLSILCYRFYIYLLRVSELCLEFFLVTIHHSKQGVSILTYY